MTLSTEALYYGIMLIVMCAGYIAVGYLSRLLDEKRERENER